MSVALGNTAAVKRPLTICAIGYATSTHVAARAHCFAEMGHRVFLITETASANGIHGVTELVPGWDEELAKKLWFRLCLWACAKLGSRAVDGAWRAIAFLRLLRRCRPDVVHVHFAYSYYGWIAGLLGCRPLVVTIMGGDVLFEEQGRPTAIGKWLTLELLRKADFITSKSNYLTEVLDRLGGFGSKAERIVWGVSLRQFHRVDHSALRQRLGLGSERRVIFSPKILQPLYRVHLVVEAMATVVRRCPEATLLVSEYGADPTYKTEIALRVAELGLEAHVVFVGCIDYSDMPAYYSLAEMSVAVPFSDGLPQTLLESMACETPNILSRLERYTEIVQHAESAFFVTETAEEIAAGIVALLDDAPLRAKIGANALEIVRREGDLDEQARRVERHYLTLAATLKPRTVRPGAAWQTWRSYRRFRAGARFSGAAESNSGSTVQ